MRWCTNRQRRRNGNSVDSNWHRCYSVDAPQGREFRILEYTVARGNRTGKSGELPESRNSRFAHRVIEAYLNEGLDEVEESLEASGQPSSMSLVLASVLLRSESIDSEVWDHWLKLEYLEAVREAVAQSLDALNAPPSAMFRPSRTVH